VAERIEELADFHPPGTMGTIFSPCFLIEIKPDEGATGWGPGGASPDKEIYFYSAMLSSEVMDPDAQISKKRPER
jgi:hypothetical protein